MKTFNQIDLKKIKFVVYIRKSSEGDERQALSPEKQRQEIEGILSRYEIDKSQIINVVEESRSAKIPRARPLFNKLIQDIDNGIYDGLLTWIPSRISRNPVDTGSVVDLMDRGKLKVIIATEKMFEYVVPMDKFWFAFQCMEAKLENDNRGINSKGGMRTKAEMGWYPAPAPLGYINEVEEIKGFKTISIDPKRWKIIKLCFQSVLEGQKPFEVLKKAQNEWKLMGKNGNVIAESSFYNMLANPFYCGRFEWSKGSGNWYQGKHKPIVTEEEFEIIQRLMGRRGDKPPQKKNMDYLYTGLIKCAKCGATISGDHKDKFYPKTKRLTKYIYYRCSRKAKTCDCEQPQISEPDLEKIFLNILSSVRPPQGFVDWANKWLAEEHKIKSKVYQEVRDSQLNRKIEIEKQLDKLLTLYLNDGLDVDSYKTRKENYESERRILEEKIKENDSCSDEHRRKIENALEYAESAFDKFQKTKSPEEKKYLIYNLGANFTLNDKKVRMVLKRYLQTSKNNGNWDKQFSDWCEPVEYKELLGKNDSIRPPKPVWLRLVDAFCNHKIEFSVNLQLLQNFFTDWQLTPSFA